MRVECELRWYREIYLPFSDKSEFFILSSDETVPKIQRLKEIGK